MNLVIQNMLKQYPTKNSAEKKQALLEIVQLITLLGLSQSSFFQEASFYGESSLRILHSLPRFSEDLDFTLNKPNASFAFDNFFPVIEKNLLSYGFSFSLQTKSKVAPNQIQSAFLKGNTRQHLLLISPDIQHNKIPFAKNDSMKIKIKVDVDPPLYANTEIQYLLEPIPFSVRSYDLPSLFAGKIHAILCRNWKNRVKGRDYYDYVWFLAQKIPVNLKHLEARLWQNSYIPLHQHLTMDILQDLLIEKFQQIPFQKAKEDVSPFIKDPVELNVWSSGFFTSITRKYLTSQNIF